LYFPKTKDKAIEEGYKWQDENRGQDYKGAIYEPKDDIHDYAESKEKRDKLLEGTLKCKLSGRLFKIIPQELAFYIDQKIPIPRKHYDVRFAERFAWRNPRRLYERQCDCNGDCKSHNGQCTIKFKTTYRPDCTQQVFCEKCYQQSVV
jgi:hypothetical protein